MGRSSWLKNPTRCSAASTWQPHAQSASSGQSDGEGLHRGGSDQDAEHLHQSRMIEVIVMLAIGLSMAGVVLGNLNNDEPV